MKTLVGRHYLSIADLSRAEVEQILDTAERLKGECRMGRRDPLLPGRVMALIFEQSSTRTRVSFEVAMRHLGGHALFLSAADLKLSRGEPIRDTARVLSSYCDCIGARIFSHDNLLELAHHSTVPVINMMTDYNHPCQILSDLMTLREVKGRLHGLRLTFLGDGNNVCHSVLLGCARMGIDVTSSNPEGYDPDPQVVSRARELAQESGSQVRLCRDPVEAVEDADALYTDVWHSPGQPGTLQERLEAFRPYQINRELLAAAGEGAVVLHCLPARRGEEITGEVMEGPQSVIFAQAENRLHAQKALLVHLVP